MTSINDKPGNATAGLVLCGGQGQRMQGRDKGLINTDGQPAVLRTLALLKPICERCFISANRNQNRYAQLTASTIISDLRPGYAGPLAGIEAVLPALTQMPHCDQLIVLPCDLPRLAADVPKRLLEELQARPDLEVVYARTGNRQHYLCAALRRSALPGVVAQLDRGERAVRDWYAACRSASLLFDVPLAEGFLNINRTDDLRAICGPRGGSDEPGA